MFRIMNRTDSALECIIFENIDDVTLRGLVDALSIAGITECDLVVASPGGDIDIGFAIYDLLDAWKNDHTLRIHASGTVSSAAILPFCIPVYRDAPIGSFFVIHSVQSGDWGDAEDHAKTAAILDAYDERLVELYKRVSTLSEEELLNYIRAETMFSAEIAKEWGFLTDLRIPDAQPSRPVDYFRIKGGIMSVSKNELSPDEIEQVKEVIVETEKVEEVKEDKPRVDADEPSASDDRISKIESAIEQMAKNIAVLMEHFTRADAPLDFMAAPKMNHKPTSVYDKSGLKFR